ncbi:MAG: tRNA (adenosine(37)-N6)-threonylcarbamoyltransferase complex transferase subunit TsaD [Thermodesulfobacteriota bacterium]
MLVLGIESSCDDMAAAVVEEGRTILSSVVSSQDDIHERYGGIVPELASRRHIETVVPVVEEAVRRSGKRMDELDGIGVTMGPGLLGSLLIGLSFAKALAYARKIPFVGVNHIVAHPLAAFLEGDENPAFPFIALVVSGGHTTLFRYETFVDYEVLGQTRDDAAGEAFDKVAKLLGFTYPGGVVIDRLASEGNRAAIPFTRPFISKDSLDFSFSGIKTAVLRHIRGLNGGPSDGEVRDIAASFQEAVVDVLVRKAFAACRGGGVENLVVAGGVACNSRLRERLRERGEEERVRVFIPPPRLCSDNGAIIAASGYHLLKGGKRGDISLDADPNLEY